MVSSVIHLETPIFLADLITKYLILHNQLFTGKLKPKHNFLIHYPRIMRAIDPLWNINYIRLQSIHRVGKAISQPIISRVNVCRAISLKHQLILNCKLMSHKSAYRVFFIFPTKIISFEKFPDIDQFFQFIWKSSPSTSTFLEATWRHFHDEKVTKNSIIVALSENGPHFFVIHNFIIIENSF